MPNNISERVNVATVDDAGFKAEKISFYFGGRRKADTFPNIGFGNDTGSCDLICGQGKRSSFC